MVGDRPGVLRRSTSVAADRGSVPYSGWRRADVPLSGASDFSGVR